ncbi:multiple epidermal growth factor-like domains protein 6 [Colias croceus]|uniref:multiple epidermal growth factor-like domains protein 6 n=1 Tax=Colias crocea TaxID=72248 RepID=UPI001E27F0B0|nr:multiple epidermal growth factor-like domains protein 6 [Colias croceus]
MIYPLYFLLIALITCSCDAYNFKCPSDGRHYLLPHETSCAKFYYCEYGVRRNDARCCAPGTLFSFEKQVCDHPHLVRCVCGNKGNIADCNGTLANGCPSDFTVRRQFPHESDCSKYYNCVKGEKLLETCPKGQHFNAKAEVCDSPANAGCDPTCSCNSTLPNGCPSDFNIEKLFPHESDCTKYYQCVHGNKVLRSCAPGTHFSDAHKRCEDPATAGCDTGAGQGGCGCGQSGCGGSCGCGETGGGESGGGSCGCGETGGGESGGSCGCGGETGGGESGGSCGCGETGGGDTGCGETGETGDGCGCEDGGGEDGGGQSGDLPNGCPADFCISRLLKHETDCCQFYFCINGEKLLAKCPNGLHFNAELQKCDDPATAGCAPVCDEKCKGCHVPFWRDQTDCTKFWRCVSGARVVQTCPEGLAFNVEKQTCDFKCNVVCSCTRHMNITNNSILNRILNLTQIEDDID